MIFDDKQALLSDLSRDAQAPGVCPPDMRRRSATLKYIGGLAIESDSYQSAGDELVSELKVGR